MPEDLRVIEAGGKAVVTGKIQGNIAYPDFIVTVEGCNRSMIARAISAMLSYSCPECGGLYTEHVDVFTQTGQEFGSVLGKYTKCSLRNHVIGETIVAKLPVGG
jgi:hypothetical protein